MTTMTDHNKRRSQVKHVKEVVKKYLKMKKRNMPYEKNPKITQKKLLAQISQTVVRDCQKLIRKLPIEDLKSAQ